MDTNLLKELTQFASGNTLVLLYIAVSVVRYIVIPMYRNGQLIKSLAQSLKTALDNEVFGHGEVVRELSAIREALAGLGAFDGQRRKL